MSAVGITLTELTEMRALRRALAHLVEVAAAFARLAVGAPATLELMVSPVDGTVLGFQRPLFRAPRATGRSIEAAIGRGTGADRLPAGCRRRGRGCAWRGDLGEGRRMGRLRPDARARGIFRRGRRLRGTAAEQRGEKRGQREGKSRCRTHPGKGSEGSHACQESSAPIVGESRSCFFF